MDGRRGRIIWNATWRAAGHRLILVSTGLTAAAGVMCQSGTLFLIAAGGWVVSFALNLSRSDLWRQAVETLDLEEVELPVESTVEEAAARQFLARLTSARVERTGILRGLDPGVAPRARTIAVRAVDLERAAVALIRALERMNTYLGQQATVHLNREIGRLGQLKEATESPAARSEIERARASLHGRLEVTGQIEGWRDLVVARLESILAALEGLPARLVRADVWRASVRSMEDDAPLAGLREELEHLDVVAEAALGGEQAVLRRRPPTPPPLGFAPTAPGIPS